MKFKYEVEKKDHRDFSSGRVLINAPQTPAFPVRIASEIMSRCLSYINSNDCISIYDPCCGGAHLLTVIGFLYREKIERVYGTEIDIKAVGYAKRNLNLLTSNGLFQRKKNILQNYNKFGKVSHLEALQSVKRLISTTLDSNHIKDIQCLDWDITSSKPPVFRNINIVITDLPYGNMAIWKGTKNMNPIEQMLKNVYYTLDLNNAVVSIICDKNQKVEHEWFEQVKRLKHGKRQFTFLRPVKY
ncbi:RRNA methyltransferase AviRa [Evansella caseinilytica]|uniref:rRNA methyltransferase AviRa n=1 Tax=Evansella caseinilytica TaxID=1503961 RepID=A0A1H3SVU9_9BACI|nr:hypothetical protein [Evansella caseinilytica]SDZ42223.1 RRNA methyltransferase AviRa [Evansella caseinilytica]